MGTFWGQSKDKVGTIAGYSSYHKRERDSRKKREHGAITMDTTTKKCSLRNKKGTSLTEFAAAISLFFCGIFVPLVDVAFVPARYLLAYNNMDKVVHRMALSEKRSQAINYLYNDKSWKQAVECWGVSVKNAKANLVVCDQTGNSKMTLADSARVPNSMLPNGTKVGSSCSYSMEVVTTVDVPPLFSSHVGLPGFTKPIEFTFRNRAQWENVSPDPYTTNDANKSVQYYINE